MRRVSLLLPAILIRTSLSALVGAAETTNAAPGAEDRGDLLIADFEGDDYGDWRAEGEAFGPGPAKGTLPGQMHDSEAETC